MYNMEREIKRDTKSLSIRTANGIKGMLLHMAFVEVVKKAGLSLNVVSIDGDKVSGTAIGHDDRRINVMVDDHFVKKSWIG